MVIRALVTAALFSIAAPAFVSPDAHWPNYK